MHFFNNSRTCSARYQSQIYLIRQVILLIASILYIIHCHRILRFLATWDFTYLLKDLQGGCEVVVAGTLIDWWAVVKVNPISWKLSVVLFFSYHLCVVSIMKLLLLGSGNSNWFMNQLNRLLGLGFLIFLKLGLFLIV